MCGMCTYISYIWMIFFGELWVNIHQRGFSTREPSPWFQYAPAPVNLDFCIQDFGVRGEDLFHRTLGALHVHALVDLAAVA